MPVTIERVFAADAVPGDQPRWGPEVIPTWEEFTVLCDALDVALSHLGKQAYPPEELAAITRFRGLQRSLATT